MSTDPAMVAANRLNEYSSVPGCYGAIGDTQAVSRAAQIIRDAYAETLAAKDAEIERVSRSITLPEIDAAVFEHQESRIDQLEKQVEELRRDAERLDALPKLAESFGQLVMSCSLDGRVFLYDYSHDPISNAEHVRAAIDAALKEQP